MIMDKRTDDFYKRESVKKNYDLIAKQYAHDFGTFIEDLDIYEEFLEYLSKDAKILDLGAGTGRTYAYFNDKGYQYIGLDFSKEMKNNAYNIHQEFPYIIDDIVNLKNHFSNNSFDAVFCVYSLFHLPTNDIKNLFQDVYDILKDEGIFLFSYQIGEGEEMSDEPYLKDEGKKVLYMNYQTNDEIKNMLDSYLFNEVFRKEKIEVVEGAINKDQATTVFVLAKKNK